MSLSLAASACASWPLAVRRFSGCGRRELVARRWLLLISPSSAAGESDSDMTTRARPQPVDCRCPSRAASRPLPPVATPGEIRKIQVTEILLKLWGFSELSETPRSLRNLKLNFFSARSNFVKATRFSHIKSLVRESKDNARACGDWTSLHCAGACPR